LEAVLFETSTFAYVIGFYAAAKWIVIRSPPQFGIGARRPGVAKFTLSEGRKNSDRIPG
jgi:hypothetical protein